jgi:hypothetical protein
MGGIVKGLTNITDKIFGQKPKQVSVPKVPDVEKEHKEAEAEAVRKRAALADKGMSGTILGGSYEDEGGVRRKKLLGE